uniref:Uncharacterized protein n=1 Tax=Steinernema glaseri TaxID=37863 RepID=A0A1I7ZRX1_9BILA
MVMYVLGHFNLAAAQRRRRGRPLQIAFERRRPNVFFGRGAAQPRGENKQRRPKRSPSESRRSSLAALPRRRRTSDLRRSRALSASDRRRADATLSSVFGALSHTHQMCTLIRKTQKEGVGHLSYHVPTHDDIADGCCYLFVCSRRRPSLSRSWPIASG